MLQPIRKKRKRATALSYNFKHGKENYPLFKLVPSNESFSTLVLLDEQKENYNPQQSHPEKIQLDEPKPKLQPQPQIKPFEFELPSLPSFHKSKYELYSGHFTGSLRQHLDLNSLIPKFVDAVKSGLIRGARYFDASTRQYSVAGECLKKIKNKTAFTTKRRRVDFDHQISVFWKKGYHVKLFKTGRLLIPACGSEKGAREAFQTIAKICNVPLVSTSFSCNNQNIRIILDTEVNTDQLFNWLQTYHYFPKRTKTNRVKCSLWWNSSYYNYGLCNCKDHCSKLETRKRSCAFFDGKCISSTVMFGKKSWTIFGTSSQKHRDHLLKVVKVIQEGVRMCE